MQTHARCQQINCSQMFRATTGKQEFVDVLLKRIMLIGGGGGGGLVSISGHWPSIYLKTHCPAVDSFALRTCRFSCLQESSKLQRKASHLSICSYCLSNCDQANVPTYHCAHISLCPHTTAPKMPRD